MDQTEIIRANSLIRGKETLLDCLKWKNIIRLRCDLQPDQHDEAIVGPIGKRLDVIAAKAEADFKAALIEIIADFNRELDELGVECEAEEQS